MFLNSKVPIRFLVWAVTARTEVWLGASDRDLEGQWKWDSNRCNFDSFTRWFEDEPDDYHYYYVDSVNYQDNYNYEANCMMIEEFTLMWFDIPCSFERPFICAADC